MENPKYLVKVEVIGEEGEGKKLSDRLKEGIECDGFSFILEQEDGKTVVMHQITTMEVAMAMAKSDELMPACYIAEGLHKAEEIQKKNVARSLAEIFGSLDS